MYFVLDFVLVVAMNAVRLALWSKLNLILIESLVKLVLDSLNIGHLVQLAMQLKMDPQRSILHYQQGDYYIGGMISQCYCFTVDMPMLLSLL